MSRSDTQRKKLIALGPFYREVEGHLARLSLKELKRLLLQHARELPSDERSTFLEMLTGAGPTVDWHAIDTSVHFDALGDLLEDVDHFVADLKSGKFFDHTAFDESLGRDRAYGDESWIEDMTDLFQRTNAEYIAGDRELSAPAYEGLLNAFLLDDGATFSGPDDPETLIPIDLLETKARYFRSIYETAPEHSRPAVILNAAKMLSHIGPKRVGIQAMSDADIKPIEGLESFLPQWLQILRTADPEHQPEAADPSWARAHIFLLKEAVEMATGSEGLAQLARTKGAKHAEFYHSWVAALTRETRYKEALQAAQEGIGRIDSARSRAVLSDRLAELAVWCDDDAIAVTARRDAWRWDPTPLRLIQYLVEGYPETEELEARVQDQLRSFIRAEYKLDGLLASMLELLAGHYNVAARRLDRASPLGWSDSGHPGPVLLPFLLHAGCGEEEPVPGTSIAALWRGMDEAVRGPEKVKDRDEDATMDTGLGGSLWNVAYSTLLQSALRRRPIDHTMAMMFLDIAANVAIARARAIVSRQHRKAYRRAAVVIIACVEAFLIAGLKDRARSFIGEFKREYPRNRAFQFELAGLVDSSPIARVMSR